MPMALSAGLQELREVCSHTIALSIKGGLLLFPKAEKFRNLLYMFSVNPVFRGRGG
jgi:hypothetical protein